MKRLMNKSMLLVGIVALFWSCSIEQDVPEPSFDVKGYEVEQIIDTLGNPVFQVSFQLSGDPDIISFYSGLVENDYNYRDGRLLDYGALNMSFYSNVRYGVQPDQFSVHISTDFGGNYTFENVKGATWTDITEGFTLGTDAPFVDSGNQDIKEYLVEGRPLYIAFRYVYRPELEAGAPNIWRVNKFNLSGVTAIGDVTIANQQSGAWSFVNNYIDDPGRSTMESNGNIMLANGNNNGSQETAAESWCVSKRLDLDIIDNGPDRAIPIKRIIDPPLTVHKFNYPESGVYEVVFIAKNVTADDEKQVIKTIQVVIP